MNIKLEFIGDSSLFRLGPLYGFREYAFNEYYDNYDEALNMAIERTIRHIASYDRKCPGKEMAETNLLRLQALKNREVKL